MLNDIPSPNRAVAGLLLDPKMRSVMVQAAEIAQALYREVVAKRTGRLAGSARIETFIGGQDNDRWCSRLIVDAPYTASHEYGVDDGDERIVAGHHDLNQVLNMLASL